MSLQGLLDLVSLVQEFPPKTVAGTHVLQEIITRQYSSPLIKNLSSIPLQFETQYYDPFLTEGNIINE